MTDPALPLPLSGTRVLDLADGRVQGIGRLLADLGAHVVRVEPSDGAADRHRGVVDDGVNLTLGLPIVRTAPDHGTAFALAGTGRAEPGAMIAAIRMAADCANRRMEAQRAPAA